MKRICVIGGILFALNTFISCKTIQKVTIADYDTMSVRKTGIIQRPLVTDLDVAKNKVIVTKIYNNMSVEDAKANTTGAFILQNNCDIVIEPYFVIKTEKEIENTKITVSLGGYPGFYRNIRNYEPKDSLAFLIKSTSNAVIVPSITNTDVDVSKEATITERVKPNRVRKHIFGMSLSYGLPQGDLKKYSAGGGYGTLNLHFHIKLDEEKTITLNTGIMGFPTNPTPNNSDPVSTACISQTVGYKYSLGSNFYVEPRLGVSFYNLGDNFGSNSDGTLFGINYALGAGYNFTKRFDLSLRYDRSPNGAGLKLGFWGLGLKFLF